MDRASAELTSLQLEAAWQQKIYTRTGREVAFGSLFPMKQDHHVPAKCRQLLVVFIRHFFCGYCQDYLRHLADIMRPTSLPDSLEIAIIGCGAHTLIDSYRKVIRCPDEWAIYSDPTTKLYDQLGMYRSLSMGNKSPAYVQHSMALGMLKSALQGMKRIGRGDVRAAGDWSVQGGEFLFECNAGMGQEWKFKWCHRMRNSRDHTEVEQLGNILALDLPCTRPTKTAHHQRTHTECPVATDQINLGRTSSLRRSLSMQRDRIVARAGRLARPTSLRNDATLQAT